MLAVLGANGCSGTTPSTTGAAVLDQANSLASFLLDPPNSLQRDLAVQFPTYRAYMLFSYLQDKWQVTPKLTIYLGLRHDFYPPPKPRFDGGFANFDYFKTRS